MSTIHGDQVLARRRSARDDSTDVVLVMTPRDFVTGVVRSSDPNPTEWFWGHYFPRDEEGHGLGSAVLDLAERTANPTRAMAH